MHRKKDNALIFEAYNKSINEMNEDRYELKPTRDGYVIIDHDIRGPNKIIARFDRDQRNDAIARYNHYTKQLSPDEIRAGFDDIRANLRAEPMEEETDDSEKITPDTYELAKAIWPPDKFPSREAWEAYVRKWWPKLGSMNRAMDKAKMKQEANRGFSANKDEWEELSASEVKANKDVRADIYDMVTAAYKSLGGHPDFPSVDRVPGDNDISSVIDTDEPDDADATILSKGTEFGRKITTLATDNGDRARKEVIAHIVGLLNTPGNYVEASGKLLDILLNKGVPTVNNADDVKRILKGKKIEWHNDGSYSRDIGGTTYVKRMLGKPYV